MADSRVAELQREIWAAIKEILSDRTYGEPLVDTTYWTDSDYRSYETAIRKVRLTIEKKAGEGPDPGDPGYEDWAKGKR